MQAGSPLWKKKYDEKAAKKARAKTKAMKKNKKKSTATDMLNLDEDDKSEVVLDSLGSFFNYLIDTDYHQDEAESSQAGDEEVTIISSDSEPLPRQKIRQVTRKVRFSHPLAYLDPNFILKQQQHENRRRTRNCGGGELSSGLPNTPAPCKRWNEVLQNSNSFYPKAGLIRQPLNPSDLSYQGNSHSSCDSSQTQLPDFKTTPG